MMHTAEKIEEEWLGVRCSETREIERERERERDIYIYTYKH